MDIDTKIASYISKHDNFTELLKTLRSIVKKHPFEETLKWGIPTYVFDQKNLVGIGAFKHHVGLWFFQGALLKDKDQILHNAQEGKTKAMRQIHFKNISEINETVLSAYLVETIENQKKGLTIEVDRSNSEIILGPELKLFLDENHDMKEAFKQLTKGKQREYASYIDEAKREKTKTDRLEKIRPMVLNGVGLNDKYKKTKKE